MIGHVFASSGATLLALAPSSDRPDEYVVLAKTEVGYAVADILAAALGEIGGPKSWLRASYFDRDEDDLDEAIEAFAKDTGRDDLLNLTGAVEHAEQVIEHRAHLAG